MPLELTVPIATGDLDPDAPSDQYTHCKALLLGNYPDAPIPCIRLNISYGYYSGGDYVQGAIHPADRVTSYEIAGSDYATLVTTHEPNPGEKTYAAAKRAIYEHLIAGAVIPDGTVV
jgi:hypothetical protein